MITDKETKEEMAGEYSDLNCDHAEFKFHYELGFIAGCDYTEKMIEQASDKYPIDNKSHAQEANNIKLKKQLKIALECISELRNLSHHNEVVKVCADASTKEIKVLEDVLDSKVGTGTVKHQAVVDAANLNGLRTKEKRDEI